MNPQDAHLQKKYCDFFHKQMVRPLLEYGDFLFDSRGKIKSKQYLKEIQEPSVLGAT